jgi:hypothetical protein
VTNFGKGIKPRVEVSQEPIIDDIDEPDIGGEHDRSFLDAFIEHETREALAAAQAAEEQATPPPAPAEEEYEPMSLSSAIAPELASQQDRLLLDFPSLAELQSLAAQLLSLGNQNNPAPDDKGVGAASGPREERENSHGEGNSIMDDEET